MSGRFEGKVIALTGSGRGIGREHALLLASEGAQLVINDVGAGTNGEGADQGPAQALAEEIVGLGGMAVATTDDWPTARARSA